MSLSAPEAHAFSPAAAESMDWQGRTVVLRAVRPSDAALLRVLSTRVALADLGPIALAAVDAQGLASAGRMRLDAHRGLAFLALDPGEDGAQEALGVVQVHADALRGAALLSIALRHDVKGRRLGERLVAKTVDVLRAQGMRRVGVPVQAGNEPMRALLRALGFVMDPRRAEPGRAVYVFDAARRIEGAGP